MHNIIMCIIWTVCNTLYYTFGDSSSVICSVSTVVIIIIYYNFSVKIYQRTKKKNQLLFIKRKQFQQFGTEDNKNLHNHRNSIDDFAFKITPIIDHHWDTHTLYKYLTCYNLITRVRLEDVQTVPTRG